MQNPATDRDYIARLWRDYIWPQKRKLFAAIFFMVLLAAATAAYTWVVKLVIDKAQALQGENDAMASAVSYAKFILPFLIGVPVISGLANYWQRILTNDIALNVIGDLQKQMFAKAHAADYAEFTKEPIGNLISKFINDVTVLSNTIITRLGQSFDERIRLFLKLITQQARVDPILEVVGGLAIAGIVIAGVYLVNAGRATGGEIAAVLTALLVLSPRLRALGTLNNVIQEGLSAVTRIFSVIDTKPTIKDAPDAKPIGISKGEIEFENVSFTYPDGTNALDTVSFTAKAGQTIALVGASGSGKSTIINLIPRLYDATHGAIEIDGQNVKDVTQASLRNNLALVSQNITLFEDSIAANIGLGKQNASRDDVINAAKNADAHNFVMALPQGYDTLLGEDGMSLSGGQRQRLSIARAMLRDAPILLLDEATSALDAETETNVQTALERLSKGRTTIVIAHKLSTVQNADEIYVLDKGRIIENGTHQTLSGKKKGAYKRLLGLQITA